jgi:hypothetical protein
VLEEKAHNEGGRFIPYPYGFEPTFHKYRLGELKNEPGQTIFVCSMADLFGDWVSTDWKIEVFQAVHEAPQHNYIFLTKNPFGYGIWPTKQHKHFDDVAARTDNIWLGVTYTGVERHKPGEPVDHLDINTNFWYLWRMSRAITPGRHHTFLSVEPLGCDICEVEDERKGGKLLEHFLTPDWGRPLYEWVIAGVETGNRSKKRECRKEWVDELADLCDRAGIPIFMKDSLVPIMGEKNMRRQFPWEVD